MYLIFSQGSKNVTRAVYELSEKPFINQQMRKFYVVCAGLSSIISFNFEIFVIPNVSKPQR